LPLPATVEMIPAPVHDVPLIVALVALAQTIRILL
jgi:hypothetical protein